MPFHRREFQHGTQQRHAERPLPSFEFQAFNPFRPAFMESGLALKESSISVKEVPRDSPWTMPCDEG